MAVRIQFVSFGDSSESMDIGGRKMNLHLFHWIDMSKSLYFEGTMIFGRKVAVILNFDGVSWIM
jgi:hypothetical protein